MKKIFFSVLAIAAIAACSKSEVQYADNSEISLAPVSKISTKAAVVGTDYPDDLHMYVFANAGLDGNKDNTVAESECSEEYLINAEFEHKNSHADNVFGGTTPYFWPNVKKLIFSGVSKSGNVNNGITPTYTWNTRGETSAWEINLTGYTPGKGTTTEGDNDLMWFPTTRPYGKDDVSGVNDAEIEVTMQHACAWVTININGDAVTGVAGDDAWKVTEVKFNNLVQIGDVKLGENAVWTIFDPAAPTDDQKTPLPVYASTGKSLTALTTTDGKKTGYTDYTKLGMTDLVVIPQTTKTLSVTYQFVSQKADDGAGRDIVISETKEIPLTYTSGNTWDAGKHYIYNIIIGTQEILVEPSVADWTPENGLVEDKEF